jgi:hypothetical protein
MPLAPGCQVPTAALLPRYWTGKLRITIFFSTFVLFSYLLVACMPSGPLFQWSYTGPIEGRYCIRVHEPSEPDRSDWSDNFLCSSADLRVQWSYNGRIEGMRCTKISEPSEPRRNHWDDNYLCLPDSSPIRLSWIYADPPPVPSSEFRSDCLQINEPSDRSFWNDNYLCWQDTRFPITPPPPALAGLPVVGNQPDSCLSEGEPCMVHPQECTARGADWEVPGTIQCVNEQPVCMAQAGEDYCNVCGGICGACENQLCSRTNLCAPTDLVCGPQASGGSLTQVCRSLRAEDVRLGRDPICPIPTGFCWTPDEVGQMLLACRFGDE